jgi:hypothetical protein
VEVVAVPDSKFGKGGAGSGVGHAAERILTKTRGLVGAKSRSGARFSADTTPSKRPMRPPTDVPPDPTPRRTTP